MQKNQGSLHKYSNTEIQENCEKKPTNRTIQIVSAKMDVKEKVRARSITIRTSYERKKLRI